MKTLFVNNEMKEMILCCWNEYQFIIL